MFGEPPADYPVPFANIPDMPIEDFHLMAFGQLTAQGCARFGIKPMRCAYCAGPTSLLWLHPPLGADYFTDAARAQRKRDGRANEVIAGTVWGQDVIVFCTCCSASTCPHCWWHGEMVLGHEIDDGGTCRRCERTGLRHAA